MNFTFQHRLDQELLRSERTRTIILISIFLIAIGFRSIQLFLFEPDDQTQQIQSLPVVWMFPLIVIAFELVSLLYINKRLRTDGKQIPLWMQYFNTAVEIALPSLIILIVARQYPNVNVLQSPAPFIYFIFIILSTLRLNFALSFFCGLMASVSYILIGVFIYNHFDTNDGGKAIILLMSGIAAGQVAKQIRNGINNSLQETEKRHKVENLFGQQISTEIAEKMLQNDGIIESRRMNVAIMFIDIRNFTKFAAGRNPEDIVQYQNAFFKIVIHSVSKYNGIVHQFLGDGCMVTFGAPLDLINPSRNAVNAATFLLNALNTAGRDGEIPETKIGIGIHTGEVITGNIGTAERQQYSITGNVVILASRIEQLNKQFGSQLLVSEDVAQSIGQEAIEATCIESVSLKGWDRPMCVYKLA